MSAASAARALFQAVIPARPCFLALMSKSGSEQRARGQGGEDRYSLDANEIANQDGPNGATGGASIIMSNNTVSAGEYLCIQLYARIVPHTGTHTPVALDTANLTFSGNSF
jgi:hypothetical protein